MLPAGSDDAYEMQGQPHAVLLVNYGGRQRAHQKDHRQGRAGLALERTLLKASTTLQSLTIVAGLW